MIEFPLVTYTLQIGAFLFHFVADGCTFVDCFVRCWSFALLSPFFLRSLPFYVLIYMLCLSSPTRTSSHIARTLPLLVKLQMFVSLILLASHHPPVQKQLFVHPTDAMHALFFNHVFIPCAHNCQFDLSRDCGEKVMLNKPCN